jgi:hypothetical protein
MDTGIIIRLGARRFIMIFIASMILIALINEGAHRLQKEDFDRAPRTVELVIPHGTAAQVEAGQPVPAIPDEMVFVVGDTLLVRNEDSRDHELGPLWVPAGSSASLVLNEVQKFAYKCSFQPSRYMGMDVRQATTWTTRLTALTVAAPGTAIFFFIYSLLIRPIKVSRKGEPEVSEKREVGDNLSR